MHIDEKTNDFGHDTSSDGVHFKMNILEPGTPKREVDKDRPPSFPTKEI